jgi:hypothetical protein
LAHGLSPRFIVIARVAFFPDPTKVAARLDSRPPGVFKRFPLQQRGQPIGVQLIAGRYSEDLALDAAAAIEKCGSVGSPAVGEDGLNSGRHRAPLA